MTGPATEALIIRHPSGETEGRDPRELTVAELNDAGHAKTPLLKAIRAKCLDCCCDNAAEVRRCTAVSCALWPYRAGKNPFTGRRGNAAALTARREKSSAITTIPEAAA